ncbi:restriction endonuclease subunit S [Staphylococcus epidermidis]|nr:restriction endonuclease subunit S [Staphylococcus epidermidis]MCG1106891.1 restriction endonuclease subunit S [Staphylococcus epidermidis]MCG1111554.1 restriction endonuclease subunit S [Staphylococcus epidermidis]MCG1115909.1 restriction endonuclease subunit S [Staphylococcus epidermidis]MCG1220164.1 restriction endonuclease subunit S [Staphylococcus epidermidis]
MTNEQKNIPELRFPEFDGEWKLENLGDLADIVRGASPRPIKDSKWFDDNSDIGWLRISDVTQQNGKIKFLQQHLSTEGQKKTRVLYEPHLLLSIAASVGKPVINYVKTGVHDGFLIFMKPKFDLYFMFNWLENFQLKWNKYGQPGSQVNLNSNLVKSQNIYIPYSYEEEKKMGTFFSKLDRQIELEEEKLELLEQQKKGYIQKIFSQELRFKDGSGNEYPEWEEKTIKDVYKVTRGYVLARKLMSDNPNSINKYPVYSSQTSNNGLMGYYSDYLYQDAITWTTDGANAGSVSFRQGKFYCTNVCGVLLNELGNSNVCMAEMLNNIAFKYVSKVGNPKLMNNVMAMIKLKFPCLEEQQAISKFLNVFSEVIDNQNKKVELLKERKKGFLQKMFV